MPLIMAPSAWERLLPGPWSPGPELFHFISGTSERPEHLSPAPAGCSEGLRPEVRASVSWVAGRDSHCGAAPRTDPRTLAPRSCPLRGRKWAPLDLPRPRAPGEAPTGPGVEAPAEKASERARMHLPGASADKHVPTLPRQA